MDQSPTNERGRQQYEVEPDSGPSAQSHQEKVQAESIPEIVRPARAAPLPVEPKETDQPAAGSVKDLDVCPNCGATMRGGNSLVCLRCGFDLKTMKQVRTVAGEATTTEESPELQSLVKPAATDSWLPMAMFIVGGLILLVMHLAGSPAVFPAVISKAGAGAPIGAAQRFTGILQLIILIAMWTGCGVAALALLAHLLGMKFGDGWAAAKRMLGVVTTVRVASIIYLPPLWLEWTVEAIIQAAAFAGLAMIMFRLKPRDVPTLLGAAVVLFLMLWLLANLIVWATA
jgi:hypothetical protein